MNKNIFNPDKLLYGILTIADIHLNTKRLKAKQIKKELQKNFIDVALRVHYLKGIVVAGDIFHDNELYLNDDNAKVAAWLFHKLYEIGKERGIWVRVIKGTESHDYSQLDMFTYYEDMYDFKIYNTVAVEKIDNLNMLFMPEEYVKNQDKYYDKYLNVNDDTYDFIFLHGLVREMEFLQQDNENFSKKAAIFDVGDLCKISSGPILAGHIHTHTVFKHQFYYVGSFSRFSHGEEEDKGILYTVMTLDTKKYIVLHYKNDMAKIYSKLVLNYDDIDEMELDKLILKINKFKEDHKVSSLDLRLHYIDSDSSHAKISGIVKYYSDNKEVKIKTKISTLKSAKRDKEYQKRRDDNIYLIDKTLSFYEKIQKYIKKKKGKNIPIDKIEKYFKPVSKKGVR